MDEDYVDNLRKLIRAKVDGDQAAQSEARASLAPVQAKMRARIRASKEQLRVALVNDNA